ncbi:MAG: hypothetical protein IH986_07200 [Planctomycetes bacterium]|nr:hypothetical protein [Planctomycetota bacterium]
MDYMRIGRLNEGDFDDIIEHTGGSRLVTDDAREKGPNADYVFKEAIIELKLVEEEGLEKADRQLRLADLFCEQQPDRPTIVLDPGQLDEERRRHYYNIMAGPLKGHVKKAAKQLDGTAERLGGQPVRVLLLVNNGYSALNQDEFAQIALKCVRNDTTKVDAVVVAGTYYYSDKFDMFTFFPFELHPVNVDRSFTSFDDLRNAWNSFASRLMTDLILGSDERARERLPVVDLSFEVDGIRFVKPTPKMGHESSFWEKARPRENSTGIATCPPVAVTFPKLTRAEWQRLRAAMPEERFCRDTFEEWLLFAKEEEQADYDPRRPFVPVEVACTEFDAWCNREQRHRTGRALCEFTATVFTERARALVKDARERSARSIVSPTYMLVRVEEIGQDSANDVCSVMLVREVGADDPIVTGIVSNLRAFFEYALAIAAAYAIKRGVGTVMYVRDRTYAWE